MSASASSTSRNRAVCSATRRASGSPVRRAQCAYTRSNSALSYSIFSKCGTTQALSTL
ncbi:hypothetical protein C1Y40_00948 [Mycobacterium talmoniae]|uniref:Uncharacterized protein n=1 Tax=Mycobacterium talmoniae TaxID=1858794 RepID=A0A2S8BQD8_9MYCO|nr:hypothetical protein C1Y40_00948 [Mycobacterium talmoniae]